MKSKHIATFAEEGKWTSGDDSTMLIGDWQAWVDGEGHWKVRGPDPDNEAHYAGGDIELTEAEYIKVGNAEARRKIRVQRAKKAARAYIQSMGHVSKARQHPTKKPPAQLQREIDKVLSKRARQGKALKQPSLGNQRLLFITFEPANTFVGVRAVPVPVDFRELDVARVWTLYNETDKRKPPTLPFSPTHQHNAFIEDRLHDWNINNGKFRYGSRVMDRDVWVLVEMKNGGR